MSGRRSLVGITSNTGSSGGGDEVRAARYSARIRTERNDGNVSEDSSNSSDLPEPEGQIRLGTDFQCKIPNLLTAEEKKNYVPRPDSLLMWHPTEAIPDSTMDEYIAIAMERYGFSMEQALGMMYWHGHRLEKSLADLGNFSPNQDEFSAEDRMLFQQAFLFHGKQFSRIRQMLPDKPHGQLVQFYYKWKKTRNHSSIMDKQDKRKTAVDNGDDGSNGSSDDESEPESKKLKVESSSSSSQTGGTASGAAAVGGDAASGAATAAATTTGGVCDNCMTTTSLQLVPTPGKGNLCTTCNEYLRQAGVMRPVMVSGSRRETLITLGRHSLASRKRKPPRNMHLSREDLKSFTTGPPGNRDAIIKSAEAHVDKLRREIQVCKQQISGLKQSLGGGVEDIRPTAPPPPRLSSRWQLDEQNVAVQAVRAYGTNFATIAELLVTKTESQVRQWFEQTKSRLSLDSALDSFHKENGVPGADAEIVDTTSTASKAEDVTNGTRQGSGGGAPPPLVKQAVPPTATVGPNARTINTSTQATAAAASHEEHRVGSGQVSRPTSQGPPPLVNSRTSNN